MPVAPPEPVDLNTVARAAVLALDGLVSARGAAIEAGPLPVVTGYPSYLLQLFTNLLENGIKYAGDKPARISVRAAPERREPGMCTIVVADEGPGIAPEQQERIFHFFRRAHDGPVEGAGIGLAVCRRVAEQQGGRIWVESEVGKGSQFYVMLPAPAHDKRATS